MSSIVEIVTKHDNDDDAGNIDDDDNDDDTAQKSLFLKSPINLVWPHFPLVLLFRPEPGFHSERNDYFHKTHNFDKKLDAADERFMNETGRRIV